MEILSVKDQFKEWVGPPFVSGVLALQSFAEVLQNESIGADVTSAEVEQLASRLRPHVTEAYSEFSTASQGASELNARVYSEVEAAVAELSDIRAQLQEIEGSEKESSIEVETLTNDVTTAETEVQNSTDDLAAAESTLQSARDTLEEKRRDQQSAMMGGMIASNIPIIGPIGGVVMAVLNLTVFEDAVNAAERVLQSAQESVQSSQERLEKSRAALASSQRKLEEKKDEREAKTNELNQTQQDYEDMKGTQARLLDVSEKLKRAVTFIATTLGRTYVLKEEFEVIYSLDTIHEPLRAIAEHFQSATLDNSQLLLGQLDLVSVGKKFQIICNKTSTKLLSDVEEFA